MGRRSRAPSAALKATSKEEFEDSIIVKTSRGIMMDEEDWLTKANGAAIEQHGGHQQSITPRSSSNSAGLQGYHPSSSLNFPNEGAMATSPLAGSSEVSGADFNGKGQDFQLVPLHHETIVVTAPATESSTNDNIISPIKPRQFAQSSAATATTDPPDPPAADTAVKKVKRSHKRKQTTASSEQAVHQGTIMVAALSLPPKPFGPPVPQGEDVAEPGPSNPTETPTLPLPVYGPGKPHRKTKTRSRLRKRRATEISDAIGVFEQSTVSDKTAIEHMPPLAASAVKTLARPKATLSNPDAAAQPYARQYVHKRQSPLSESMLPKFTMSPRTILADEKTVDLPKHAREDERNAPKKQFPPKNTTRKAVEARGNNEVGTEDSFSAALQLQSDATSSWSSGGEITHPIRTNAGGFDSSYCHEERYESTFFYPTLNDYNIPQRTSAFSFGIHYELSTYPTTFIAPDNNPETADTEGQCLSHSIDTDLLRPMTDDECVNFDDDTVSEACSEKDDSGIPHQKTMPLFPYNVTAGVDEEYQCLKEQLAKGLARRNECKKEAAAYDSCVREGVKKQEEWERAEKWADRSFNPTASAIGRSTGSLAAMNTGRGVGEELPDFLSWLREYTRDAGGVAETNYYW